MYVELRADSSNHTTSARMATAARSCVDSMFIAPGCRKTPVHHAWQDVTAAEHDPIMRVLSMHTSGGWSSCSSIPSYDDGQMSREGTLAHRARRTITSYGHWYMSSQCTCVFLCLLLNVMTHRKRRSERILLEYCMLPFAIQQVQRNLRILCTDTL